MKNGNATIDVVYVSHPSIPDETFAAPVQGKGEFVAIVPPEPGTTGKYQVLPIKA